MCDVPSIAVFCSESIECSPSTASKLVALTKISRQIPNLFKIGQQYRTLYK